MVLQAGLERDVHPAGEVGRFQYHAGAWVERPGRADPNAVVRDVVWQDLFDPGDHPLDDRIGAFLCVCWYPCDLLRLGAFTVKKGDPHVGAAQIDRDQMRGHGGSIA